MDNITIILLGATGDLTRRKIIPALCKLIDAKKLKDFAIVGAAIDATNSDAIVDNAQEFIQHVDDSCIATLKKNMHYQQLDFSTYEGFEQLTAFVTSLEKKQKLSGNRVVYCATAAHFFCDITQHAAKSGLVKKFTEDQKVWHRIVFEKPFGHDEESAHAINACIAQNFDERQVYRIDHYLTKELVSNIAMVRFTNCVFEPLWNNRYVDNVQIILSERACVEKRGAYYDKYGALSDVVQNHMLELLAIIGMESPKNLTGEEIRDERAKVLRKIEFVDGLLGQYEGYTQELHVKEYSKTETFAAVYARVNNPRWAGVPFYLKTGKCLDKKETVIHIKFKQVDCLLAQSCPTETNVLTIRVAPDASFFLQINSRQPGTDKVMPVKMEFCHSCLFGPLTPEAYEVLFEEIMRGEQSISVRFDEIEYAWKFIDKVKDRHLRVYPYKKQSNGPKELKNFERKHGMKWKS